MEVVVRKRKTEETISTDQRQELETLLNEGVTSSIKYMKAIKEKDDLSIKYKEKIKEIKEKDDLSIKYKEKIKEIKEIKEEIKEKDDLIINYMAEIKKNSEKVADLLDIDLKAVSDLYEKDREFRSLWNSYFFKCSEDIRVMRLEDVIFEQTWGTQLSNVVTNLGLLANKEVWKVIGNELKTSLYNDWVGEAVKEEGFLGRSWGGLKAEWKESKYLVLDLLLPFGSFSDSSDMWNTALKAPTPENIAVCANSRQTRWIDLLTTIIPVLKGEKLASIPVKAGVKIGKGVAEEAKFAAKVLGSLEKAGFGEYSKAARKIVAERIAKELGPLAKELDLTLEKIENEILPYFRWTAYTPFVRKLPKIITPWELTKDGKKFLDKAVKVTGEGEKLVIEITPGYEKLGRSFLRIGEKLLGENLYLRPFERIKLSKLGTECQKLMETISKIGPKAAKKPTEFLKASLIARSQRLRQALVKEYDEIENFLEKYLPEQKEAILRKLGERTSEGIDTRASDIPKALELWKGEFNKLPPATRLAIGKKGNELLKRYTSIFNKSCKTEVSKLALFDAIIIGSVDWAKNNLDKLGKETREAVVRELKEIKKLTQQIDVLTKQLSTDKNKLGMLQRQSEHWSRCLEIAKAVGVTIVPTSVEGAARVGKKIGVGITVGFWGPFYLQAKLLKKFGLEHYFAPLWFYWLQRTGAEAFEEVAKGIPSKVEKQSKEKREEEKPKAEIKKAIPQKTEDPIRSTLIDIQSAIEEISNKQSGGMGVPQEIYYSDDFKQTRDFFGHIKEFPADLERNKNDLKWLKNAHWHLSNWSQKMEMGGRAIFYDWEIKILEDTVKKFLGIYPTNE